MQNENYEANDIMGNANEAIVNTELDTVGIYDSGNFTIESLVSTYTDLYDFDTCSNTDTNTGTNHTQEQR